jgi:hypothetical protein
MPGQLLQWLCHSQRCRGIIVSVFLLIKAIEEILQWNLLMTVHVWMFVIFIPFFIVYFYRLKKTSIQRRQRKFVSSCKNKCSVLQADDKSLTI